MNMQRIQVYADIETKRRIELAAAKHKLPVSSYCLEAIKQQLSEDELLDETQVDISVKPSAQTGEDDLFEEMRDLRERIKARRGGELIIDDVLEQVRAEREEELTEGALPN
jgi:hypothetical protein